MPNRGRALVIVIRSESYSLSSDVAPNRSYHMILSSIVSMPQASFDHPKRLTLTLPLTLSLTLLDHLAAAVAGKKSKCSLGMNAVPYLVYQKSPKILKFLLQIMKRA